MHQSESPTDDPTARAKHDAGGAGLKSLSEAAVYLGQHEATLRWRRAQGLLPKSFRLGRRVMYKTSDLDAWIAEAYATAAGGAL